MIDADIYSQFIILLVAFWFTIVIFSFFACYMVEQWDRVRMWWRSKWAKTRI